MNKNIAKESVIGLVLLATLFGLLDPFNFFPHDMIFTIVMVILLVVFTVIGGVVVQGDVIDERDNEHRQFAGRVAFWAGSLVLLVGIVSQELLGRGDNWIIGAFAGMILARVIVRMFLEKTK